MLGISKRELSDLLEVSQTGELASTPGGTRRHNSRLIPTADVNLAHNHDCRETSLFLLCPSFTLKVTLTTLLTPDIAEECFHTSQLCNSSWVFHN